VALYSNSPPVVDDLLNELEKKTRVPKSTIQLIFKGQKMHHDLSAKLSKFGIFSGNKLQMVGERVLFESFYFEGSSSSKNSIFSLSNIFAK